MHIKTEESIHMNPCEEKPTTFYTSVKRQRDTKLGHNDKEK